MASTRFPCGCCGGAVRWNQEAIECDICSKWLHCRCIGVSKSEYAKLQLSEDGWCCDFCYRSALPYADCSFISSTSDESDQSIAASVASSVPPGCHRTSMSVYYTNCRSLLPKMDELRLLAVTSRPDLIAISESWLDPSIAACEVAIPSYQLFRRDRSRHGGGVCLYISDSISVSHKSSHESAEFLHVEIASAFGPFLFGLCYRPPGSDLDLSLLESLLGSLNLARFNRVMILGDFNVDLTQVDSLPATDLLGVAASVGLVQVIDQPTRDTNSSSSLLDHVYTSDISFVTCHSILPPLHG